MFKTVSYQEINNKPNIIWVDVRSEGEFAEATIPGAINIPLFDNEERALVGTKYHRESPDDARLLGVEIVSPKIPSMVRDYRQLAVKGTVAVFCWRGGWRSQAVATLLALAGIRVLQLQGGYRSHRRWVVSFLEEELPLKAIVLHGLTGAGKTEVLEILAEAGEPVLDLEGLAHNRGSVFGQIGMLPPPSQKMFESLIVQKLEQSASKGYFFVECESRRVGRVIVPSMVMEAMDKGGHVLLYTTLEERVKRLVRLYTEGIDNNIDGLIRALDALQKRIGREKVDHWKEEVLRGNFGEVARDLLLEYYDPLYRYPSEPSSEYDLSVTTGDPQKAVRELIRHAQIFMDGFASQSF